jgi:hypothetical protein
MVIPYRSSNLSAPLNGVPIHHHTTGTNDLLSHVFGLCMLILINQAI